MPPRKNLPNPRISTAGSQHISLLDRLKKHWLITAFSIISIVTITVANTTTAIESLMAQYGRHFSSTISREKLPEVIQKLDGTEEGFSRIYEELSENILSPSDAAEKGFQSAREWDEALQAEIAGGITVISTAHQYKIPGFVLFLNSRTMKPVLFQASEEDFPLGIKGMKVAGPFGVEPNHVVMIKYITITGTGTYGESVRFYAIGDNDQVWHALEKPYMEVNSLWGAFKGEDTVQFETKNNFLVENGTLEINTNGRIEIGADEVRYKSLPEERYVWNRKTQQFDQIKGRITNKASLMTELYSDLANPSGNWFKKPRVLKNREKSETFTSEVWK